MYGFVFLCVIVNIIQVNFGMGYEGDQCFHQKTNTRGMCINIKQCGPAIQELRKRIVPQTCSFDGKVPVVCCPNAYDQPIQTPRPGGATTQRPPKTTTEYIPPVYDYTSNDPTDGCPPIPPEDTLKKTGKKALDKCIEYQEKLIYPCEKKPSLALDSGFSRRSNCNHQTDQLIVGGTDASLGEFPHMALLGFGSNPRPEDWVCAGTLISEKFVLTAGHCTYSRELGAVTFILVGAHQRSTNPDKSGIYPIKKIIKHPDYKPPSKYNDIALLESQREIKLSALVVPACVDVDWSEDVRAAATGWGTTQWRGETADVLQKVTLEKFTLEECRAKYRADRNLKSGIQSDSQICYGAHNDSKDTCQGDSGGPLQVRHSKIKCMYTIIGVTSFGKVCGDIGVPGIYTRVAKFVDWIESVVWS